MPLVGFVLDPIAFHEPIRLAGGTSPPAGVETADEAAVNMGETQTKGAAMSSKSTLPLLTLTFVLLLVATSTETAPAQELDEEAVWKKANLYFDPLPEIAENPENPVTEAKVELGIRLYFDTRLSRSGGTSCNSCHDLARFGADHEAVSRGEGGQSGERNSPTVLNAALHVAQFWDGRAEDVEQQAGMPVTNPIEMAIPSEEFLVERLAAVPEYVDRFEMAFPDEDEPLSYRNITRALAAFERTLLTPAPFDRYLQGDREAISQDAKRGMTEFLALGCGSCHNGVTVGGHIFRRFGLNEDYWVHTGSEQVDEGRFEQTGDEEDRYIFKVGSLRNVEKTAPYFHDGSVETLEKAIRVMARAQTGTDLSAEDAEAIAAFLRTLTGELSPRVRHRLEELGYL